MSFEDLLRLRSNTLAAAGDSERDLVGAGAAADSLRRSSETGYPVICGTSRERPEKHPMMSLTRFRALTICLVACRTSGAWGLVTPVVILYTGRARSGGRRACPRLRPKDDGVLSMTGLPTPGFGLVCPATLAGADHAP